MRFAIAASILAQTLPAVTSTTSSAASEFDSLSVLTHAVEHHRHAKSLVAATAATKSITNKKTSVAVAAALKKKESSTATSTGGILKNEVGDKASTSASWMEKPVPCDPTIKVQNQKKDREHVTAEADTGVLSCGTTGLYYCKESNASPLGGFCVSKQSKQNSPKHGKESVGTTTSLRNQKKMVPSPTAKTRQQEQQAKKTFSSMEECEPKSSFSKEDVDPDVGVLSVTECKEEGEDCVKSNESSLGGICMSKQEQQQRQEQQQPFLGSSRRQLVQRQHQQHRRSLEQEVGFATYYDFMNYWETLFVCDLSDYDNTTSTGSYVCMTPDVGLGPCVGSFTISAEVEGGDVTTYSFTSSYTAPYVQTIELTYDYEEDTTCEIVFDGVTCNSCTYSLFNYVDYNDNVVETYCYDFDCSNALEGHVGSSCNTYGDLPLFTLTEECFFNTTTEDDLLYPRCSICPEGQAPNPSANLTTVYGSKDCTEAFLYGFYGFVSPTICSVVQDAAAESCGCSSQCSICGDGLLTNPDATIQSPNGETIVCANLYYGGILGYISNDDCPAAQLAATSTCCGREPAPVCDICGEVGDQNPDFTFEGDDGQMMTCAELDGLGQAGFIAADECGLVQESVEVACCGAEPFICSFCPDDAPVADPDRLLQLPGQLAITCGDAQAASLQGFISEEQCSIVQLTVPILCGCAEANTGTRRIRTNVRGFN